MARVLGIRTEASLLGQPGSADRSAKSWLPKPPRSSWPRTVRVQGNLLCDERVIVGTKVAGRIASLGEDTHRHPVDLGSEVREGDVLARLETEEFELKAQQAESQLEQVRAALGLEKAQNDSQLDPSQVPSVMQEKALWDAAQDNWNRAKALERETAISGEELQQRKSLVDVAAARYESALHGVNESLAQLGVRRAELGLARQVLRDAEIRRPVCGGDRATVRRPGRLCASGSTGRRAGESQSVAFSSLRART